MSKELKSTACDECVDYWDCIGNCSFRNRQKRLQHKEDDQLLLIDIKDWTNNSVKVSYLFSYFNLSTLNFRCAKTGNDDQLD